MPRTSRPGAPFRVVKPRSLLALAVASLEAGHTTTGVQNLLLAGVEGVAVRAHVYADLTGGDVSKVLPQVQVTVVGTYSG